jgi:hypothetical protein
MSLWWRADSRLYVAVSVASLRVSLSTWALSGADGADPACGCWSDWSSEHIREVPASSAATNRSLGSPATLVCLEIEA